MFTQLSLECRDVYGATFQTIPIRAPIQNPKIPQPQQQEHTGDKASSEEGFDVT